MLYLFHEYSSESEGASMWKAQVKDSKCVMSTSTVYVA